MALHLKEYRDPADGHTYQYDEGDQPKHFELVEPKAAKAKEPAGFTPNKPADEKPADEKPANEKKAKAPENKAAAKPADTKD